MKLIIILLFTTSLLAQDAKLLKLGFINSLALTQDSIIGIVTCNTQIRQDPDLLIKRIVIELEKGDKVRMDSIVNNDWYKISKDGYSGYILTINIKFDSENHEKMNKLIKQRKTLLREQQEKDDKKNQEEFKKHCYKKYGKKWGQLVIDKKIKIGMTDKMVIDSWGEPEDINRTVGSWGVHEQWVYGLGQYLYFENGKLTSWQD